MANHWKRRIIIPILLGFLCLGSVQAPALAWEDVSQNYFQMDDNAMLHFQKGQQWMFTRQYEAAIQEFQIGIRLKPRSAMSAALYNNMGMAYLKIHEVPKAIISFQRAVELDPNFSLYYENLAKAYRQNGQLDQAISDLQGNLDSYENQTTGWYLLGVMFEATSDFQSAKSAFKKYLKLSPQSTLADAAREKIASAH